MDDDISAVILAAGLSKRMGTPKMLLPWGGNTILGQVVLTYARAGVKDVVIVTGGARQAVEGEVLKLSRDFPVRSIYNPQHEAGEMLSSLHCGLKAVGGGAVAVLIGLGDQPQLSLEALGRVISAYAESGARLVVPSCNMRRGHPWLVGRPLWQEILALSAPQTMRQFLSNHPGDIHYVETDATILKDMDTLEDYQREKP